MKVDRLYCDNNLENIPHMLRTLALAIERGEHGEINGLLVVMDNADSGNWPPVFGFGKDESLEDIKVIGLLELSKLFISQNAVTRR